MNHFMQSLMGGGRRGIDEDESEEVTTLAAEVARKQKDAF
jgi:hypothetical protein